MWQTDSYALRLLWRVNWLLYRPMVAFMGPTPAFPTHIPTWGYLDDSTAGLIGGENGNGQTYAEPAYQR